MRLIDADALTDRIEADKKQDNISPGNFFLFKAYIMNAPTIEPDSDTISRSQAIKDVSEWATDILHPDRLIKEDAIHILESLPSAEQITGKLNNPDDSLLTADSEACKEQKSKLDLISRQDALAEFRDGRDVYDIMESIEELPSVPDSRQRETNKEIAERIINNTCKNRVFCELYPDACQKEKCDIYLVINTFLNTPDTDTPSRQRGEWIFEPKDAIELMFTKPKCSECGFESADGGNFCPNCGADMRGEEE